MRKLFSIPAILGIILLCQSCSKQSISEAVAPQSTNIINATVAPNGNYQLPLDNSSNATIMISKQAAHFQVSQAWIDSKSGLIVYNYIPAADYRGTDEVILSNTKVTAVTGSGCSNNANHNSGSTNATTSSTSYTTIKISVTD